MATGKNMRKKDAFLTSPRNQKKILKREREMSGEYFLV
jgi:hypothetical protein